MLCAILTENYPEESEWHAEMAISSITEESKVKP